MCVDDSWTRKKYKASLSRASSQFYLEAHGHLIVWKIDSIFQTNGRNCKSINTQQAFTNGPPFGWREALRAGNFEPLGSCGQEVEKDEAR